MSNSTKIGKAITAARCIMGLVYINAKIRWLCQGMKTTREKIEALVISGILLIRCFTQVKGQNIVMYCLITVYTESCLNQMNTFQHYGLSSLRNNLKKWISYTLSHEYRGGEKSIFTVVIYWWRSPSRQFAHVRTIEEYDITMPVLYVRVTSQINCGGVTMSSLKKLWNVCSGHEIAR